ncbi:MAG: cation diffusion facilitator family transporter [Candidatus Poribacteria bacterium]
MHEHSHQHSHLQGKFGIAVGLTFATLIAEVIGGILTNSLALLSDAAHVFADVFALVLSWVAVYLTTLPATNRRTYGYHRAEVLAAFFNGASLLAISGWIFYEAYNRLLNPEPVKSLQMLIIAAVGLLVNLGVALLFLKESHDNLNVKSAFLHVIGDALSSAGVIIGGIIMTFTKWYLVDPILSFVIGAVILLGAFRITREALHILLEGTPRNINLDEVTKEIKELGFIKEVHDLHIWSIRSDYSALSAHVLVDAQSVRAMQNTLSAIGNMLKEKFGIFHTTIQIECGENGCMDSLLCDFRHSDENHDHDKHDHEDHVHDETHNH